MHFWHYLLHPYVDCLLIIVLIVVCIRLFLLLWLNNRLIRICQGHLQRLLNLSILQTLTWIVTIILCIVCMFRTVAAAVTAIFIFIFSRTMLVSGCQAVITTKWISIQFPCFSSLNDFLPIDFPHNSSVLFWESCGQLLEYSVSLRMV